MAIVHPDWSGLTQADARNQQTAPAVEISDRGVAIGCDRPHSIETPDLRLTGGGALTPCATDDAHLHAPGQFGGRVIVKAAEKDPDARLGSLRAGHQLATRGVRIARTAPGARKGAVESSALRGVIVQGCGSTAIAVHGAAMTRTEVLLARFDGSPRMRVGLIDAAGRRGSSNPGFRAPDGQAIIADVDPPENRRWRFFRILSHPLVASVQGLWGGTGRVLSVRPDSTWISRAS